MEDWFIFDSETVTLRPELSGVYPGSGSPAAVKVHKELSVGRGCMTDYHLSPAKEHDSPSRSPSQEEASRVPSVSGPLSKSRNTRGDEVTRKLAREGLN